MQNNKLFYIIGAIVILLIVGVGAFYMLGWNKGGTNVQYGLDGTKTYSNNEGSVTVGNSATMPDNWPSDVPANYSGAKILYSGNTNPETGTKGAAVSYTVEGGSVQAITDYYKSGLAAQGWKLEGNADMGGQTIIGATKDTRTFGVSILNSGNGTITVIAGLEL